MNIYAKCIQSECCAGCQNTGTWYVSLPHKVAVSGRLGAFLPAGSPVTSFLLYCRGTYCSLCDMRTLLLTITLFCAAALQAHSLTVLYMAQAGYDPLDVERRGAEFTRETGIEVDFRFEEYDDMYGIVTGEEGEKGEFDVVLLDNIWTADFAAREILEPVPPDVQEYIRNGTISEIYSANVFDHTMWGVPFLANFQLLFTNMDILRSAGYSRPPDTLDQMREMAMSAKALGLIEYPIFDSLRAEEILMCELVWLSGAYGNEWDSSDELFPFDTVPNRKALSFLHGLLEEGLLNPYSLYSGEVFAAEVFEYGDALFTTNWTFLIGRLQNRGQSKPFEFEVSVIPTEYEGQKSSTVSGYQGLAVMKNSQHKEDAWDFILYLSSPEFQRRYLDEFPVWKEIWSEPYLAQSDPFFETKREQVSGAKVRYMHPQYQQISESIVNAVHDSLSGRIPVDSAFKTIDETLKEIQ